MIRIKKILTWAFPWVIIGCIAVLFYRTLSDNWHKLDGVNFTINVFALTGMLMFMLAVIVSGILWGRLLVKLSGFEVSVVDAVRIHCASWLLKYIPGQVGSYLNKIAWGKKVGISKKTISTSFIYENVLMVLAGVALSVPVFLLFKDILGNNVSLFIPVLVVLPMLIVLSRPAFQFLLNSMFKVLKKKPFKESDFLPTRDLVLYQLGYLLPRLLNGVGFVFIVQSLVSVGADMYVGLAAIYILASIVGLLAIFVPGGLGVREAVIVVFASVYFPVEQAIILALVARLYATISDLGVAAVYIILNKGKIKQL